jgi:hypothetical protein
MSSFVSLSDTSTSSSIYLTTLLKTDSVLTPAGSEVTVKDVGVSPRLYFNLVKSKLKTVEKDKLETQLRQLQSLMPTADDLGQTALYEHLSQALAIAVRELEVAAVGCDRYVEKDTIEKFRKVRWEQGKPIVYFEKWEKFPRVPPSEVPEVDESVRRVLGSLSQLRSRKATQDTPGEGEREGPDPFRQVRLPAGQVLRDSGLGRRVLRPDSRAVRGRGEENRPRL